MAIVRWEPFRDLTELNRLFTATGPQRRWLPAMDLTETTDAFVLTADLPGLGEEDVRIEVRDGVLIVSGERKAEQAETGAGYRRVERAQGSFSRSVTLPKGVDVEAVTASFDRGVLEIRIPKPAERKPHIVSIAPKAIAAESAAA